MHWTKMLLMIMLMMNMLMKKILHPILQTTSLMIFTLLISLHMGLKSNSHLVPFMLMLMIIGGVIIIVMMFSSIIGMEIKTIKFTMMSTILWYLIPPTIFFQPQNINIKNLNEMNSMHNLLEKKNSSFLFSYEYINLSLIFMFMLLFFLFLCVKMLTLKTYGPMVSKLKYV